MSNKGLVRYADETERIECPFGSTTRVVTGGEGGIANVHVVEADGGNAHFHSGYNEVYYVLEGQGRLTIEGVQYTLCPGAVAVIPAGSRHAIKVEENARLKFVIFGTPAMSVEDSRYMPVRCEIPKMVAEEGLEPPTRGL